MKKGNICKKENTMKNKVAFIGPSQIHEAFSDMDPNWDFQVPVETLEEFEADLGAEENQKIASDTSIIIFFSHLFNGEEEAKFAQLVAFLAPYSAVCILYPEAEGVEMKDYMTQLIDHNLQAMQSDDPDGDHKLETPYYFIDYDKAQESLSDALAQYVRDPLSNDNARKSILANMPDNVARILQSENDESGNIYEDIEEELIIPDKSPEGKGRVIAVTSSKGGSGKSTISMMLGHTIAKGSNISVEKGLEGKDLKVIIVDLDVRDGQLGFLNGHQSPTVIDILTSGPPTQENIKNGIFHSPDMMCDFIFAAKRPRTANEIPADFYVSLIHTLREMYDYIILDTSVNYRDPLLEHVAYPMADKVVFVTDMGISSIFGMARWIQETTRVEDNKDPIDPEKIGIVVNKVMNDVNMGIEKIEALSKGRPILSMFPNSPKLITYAANTCSLEQTLNYPNINKMAKRLADTIVEPTGYNLAQLPYIK